MDRRVQGEERTIIFMFFFFFFGKRKNSQPQREYSNTNLLEINKNLLFAESGVAGRAEEAEVTGGGEVR